MAMERVRVMNFLSNNVFFMIFPSNSISDSTNKIVSVGQLSYHRKHSFTRGAPKVPDPSGAPLHQRGLAPLVHSLFSDILGRDIIVFKQLWHDMRILFIKEGRSSVSGGRSGF